MDTALQNAMKTAFTTVKTDVLAVVGDALPIALAIMGVGLAIGLGVKFFKRVAK